MKRRYLWGILAAVMALGTIGCGKKADVQIASVTEGKDAQKVSGADSQSETSGAQEQSEGTVAENQPEQPKGANDPEKPAAGDDGKTYTIRIAIVSSDSHLHNTVLNEWAKEAEEKTGGRLILKVMGSSQLGGERDYVEGMQLGNIEMAQVSSAAVNGFLSDFSILSFPYFFKDYQEMEKVFNGPMGEELFSELETIGIKGLTWFSNGFRNVYTKKTPVTVPADMKGLKIRVMESDVMIGTLNAMGGSGTPMAYSELYSAIQQGVMDGAENALGNIYSDGYYEICKNVSLTEHFAPPGVVAVSMKTYDALPADLQEYLTESAIRFGKLERERDEMLQEEMKTKLEEKGVQINEVDKDSFIEATKKIYTEYSSDISDTVKDLAEKELGKSFQ